MTPACCQRLIIVLLTVLICGSSAAYALEGYYTEEEVRIFNPFEPKHRDTVFIRKSWYSSDLMRKDEQLMGTTIARFDRGKIYKLNHNIKSYIEVPVDFMREYAHGGLIGFGAQANSDGSLYFPDDIYVRTDAEKEIGLWNCYQVITNSKYRSAQSPYVIFWFSAEVDFPIEVFGDQIKKVFSYTPEVDNLFDRLAQFEGFPVKTETHGATQVTTTTLIKFERLQDIESSLFEVPSDYKREILGDEIDPEQVEKVRYK